MNHRRVLFAMLLPAALVLTLVPSLFAQAIQKSLYVSVVDRAGAPVADVRQTDLVVREDGVAREILSIRPADDPMQVAILVDNSQASSGFVPDVRRALPPLVDALLGASARNEIAIIGLAGRPTILTDFTRDRARLQKGIDLVWPEAATASYLLDGLVEVAQGFKKREAARPVIIAITTEGPEYSSRHYGQVLTTLDESGAAFYAFVVGQPSQSISQEEMDRNTVIEKGTRDTGGHRETVLASTGLGFTVNRLANELTHQYRVTYARPQSLIPPDRVTVSASRAGLTARGTLVRDNQRRQ